MASEYSKDSETSKFLTYIFGLPFLAPNDVGDCFAIDFSEFIPQTDAVTKFADYLVENYIAEDSKFPPHLWAEHSSSLNRTTNGCESFHSKFNSSFYTPHPNFLQFLEVLKDFQMHSYIKQKGALTVKKLYDRRVLDRQNFVNVKIIELSERKISIIDFVKCISYKFRFSLTNKSKNK